MFFWTATFISCRKKYRFPKIMFKKLSICIVWLLNLLGVKKRLKNCGHPGFNFPTKERETDSQEPFFSVLARSNTEILFNNKHRRYLTAVVSNFIAVIMQHTLTHNLLIFSHIVPLNFGVICLSHTMRPYLVSADQLINYCFLF